MKEFEQQPNQSLAKAILVLESFTSEQPEWGVRELSRKLEINATTIYRLVATFQGAGYLEQNVETQKYRLGPRVIKLASVYTHVNPITTWARRVFERYRDSFEFNFYLGQLSGFEVAYLAVLDGHGPIKVVVEPGGSTSLHATALGKVLLAFQDQSYFEAYLAHDKLQKHTDRTIVDPGLLRQQLRQIRVQQYAINDGEFYDDVGAVGVPLFDQHSGVKLCVSLAYPRHIIMDGRRSVDELVMLARQIVADIEPYVHYSY